MFHIIVAFVLALAMSTKIKIDTVGKWIATIFISTILGIVFAIVGGFLFPTLAVTVKTQAEILSACAQAFVGAVFGWIGAWVAEPISDWIGKLKT